MANYKNGFQLQPTAPRGFSEKENSAGYSAGAKNDNAGGWAYGSNVYNTSAEDYDPDLYRAAILQRYISGEGGLKNQVESYAGGYRPDLAQNAMGTLLARAGQRKEMKGQLSGLSALQGQEEAQTMREGERAIGEGVKNTRQNYNQRGLLYGGMREGGEEKVRAAGAATMAENVSGVRQDYAKQGDALKKSIAALGLASQAETQARQQQVMEQSIKNQVARAQAYQQLGEGVGYAAGTAYGSMSQKAPAAQPNYNNATITGGSYRNVGSVA